VIFGLPIVSDVAKELVKIVKSGVALGAWVSLHLFAVVPLDAQQSTLTVLKLVYPVNDATVFSFTLEGSGPDLTFELMGGESEILTVDPGTYILRETVPEDWELGLIRCGLTFAAGPVASGALQIEIPPAESVTCRFLNVMPGIPVPPPPGLMDVPVLSPTAVSILCMALATAGGLLLRKAI
jgi:hypothetical protein